jgi:membrane-associated phospholipid phosphatase
VYFRRNERFGRVRDALLAANYVSIVVMFVFPLAPPRMLGSFVDTLDANRVNLHSSVINALNNPYSAMPSLHASYAIVLGVAGVVLSRHWWSKLIWLLYPVLVTYSIVATGNHYVLDVVAGAVVLLATPVVSWASSRLALVWGNRAQLVGVRADG